MNRYLWLLAGLAGAQAVLAGPLAAQEPDFPDDAALLYQDRPGAAPMDLSYLYNPQYSQMVRIAYVTWPEKKEGYSFHHLRSFYRWTRQYDPLGEKILARLGDYARKAQEAGTKEEKDRLAGLFQGLVFDHLAHMDVVLLALSHAREDSAFGDPTFYEWVRNGILYDIMSKSNGKTMSDPYELITMGEETAIFNALKVRPVHTELVSDGSKFFNLHLVENLRDGQRSELHTDVTVPMRHLKADYLQTRESRSRSLNLPRQ